MKRLAAMILGMVLAGIGQAGIVFDDSLLSANHWAAENQLFNGDFEEEGLDGWEGSAALITAPDRGGQCARLEGLDGDWVGIEQNLRVPIGARTIVVSGRMKGDTVDQGDEDWKKANIGITFQTAGTRRIGDYPEPVLSVVGATEWRRGVQCYRLPPGCAKVLVSCALDMTLGRVLVDDVKATFFDSLGKALACPPKPAPIDEGKWYPLVGNPALTGANFVDWSSLLDKPAGKHGFLGVKNGRFTFADGSPAKFYGAVLCGPNMFTCDSAQADSLATRLSRMGCNLLRMHHMDAEWAEPNIFGNTDSTTALDTAALRHLDYLVNACKKRGIYLFFDMIVNRQFFPKDGVSEKPIDLGAKQVGFFSPKLIELQKQYITQLMNHVNVYSGIAYKDDPAIALSEIINETTIFTLWGGDGVGNGLFRLELDSLWRAAGNTGEMAQFGIDWSSNPHGTLSVEDSGSGVKKTIAFLSKLEEGYFKEMVAHFRSIGVKYPIAGSNYPMPILAMLKDNAACDWVANDAYWDHPDLEGVGGDWNRVKEAPIDNASQILAGSDNAFGLVSFFKTADKPYVMWGNHSWPSEYRLEEVPLMAAYASLQGWDGVVQHEFDFTPLGVDSLESFMVSRDPEDIAQWVYAAPLFLRGDIATAPGQVTESISDAQCLSDSSYSDFTARNHWLPFVTKIAKTFNGKALGDPKAYVKYCDTAMGIYRSETGELALNSSNGTFTLNAPRVQGAVGFLGKKKFSLNSMDIAVSNTNASIVAVSRDGKPLLQSKHFYLVAMGPSKMTGQKFDESRTALENGGTLPVLVQVVEGSILLKQSGKLKVFPLTTDGRRGTPLNVTAKGGKTVLDLSTATTPVFEVLVE